ncbi:nucleotide exchange factor GrpE [Glycomyces sp. NRRL B-16210]|uniref:nucleotide exchange factor GrpE n=1 Tax=Glycomyces sp. NRRL B-16210 TaxID=1463821 RepID=UPI00068AE60F|nr:nucleotide exchange factor GrpE [Glycomyces sp. NRRL B-16210]
MTAEDGKDADDTPPDEQNGDGGGTGENGAVEGDGELTVDDILAAASDDGQAADDAVLVLQATLEERTRDLQRITAEFQNYRKRVERDKARAGELATAAVLQSLLPVLDDLDRARDHGDLTGPFGSVADQLLNALTKQGLESFGTKGDRFDPTVHEAVAHMQMPGVDGPTCIDVMRSGYRLGDKLLRAALVAVAEPADEDEAAPAEEPEAPETDEAEEPAEASEAEAPEASDGAEPAEADDTAEAGAEESSDEAVQSDAQSEDGPPAAEAAEDEPAEDRRKGKKKKR